jgi:hypothetical protein
MKLITRSTQHNRVYYVTDIVYRVVMDHYKAVTEKKDCLRVRHRTAEYCSCLLTSVTLGNQPRSQIV